MTKTDRGRPPQRSPRFSRPLDERVARFTSSLRYDTRLAESDIAGSIAHALGLVKARIVSGKEGRAIISGLRRILAEIRAGEFRPDPSLEDIHMNIESRLTALTPAGAKVHTGRSRNDQVATDLRLYLRKESGTLLALAAGLMEALLRRAGRDGSVPMPGLTHLQPAQPVLLGHHLLAHFWRLERDAGRLQDAYGRINVSPLGSAALAGTPYNLDRAFTARLLGFERPCENSMDGVSDRDFAAELLSALALVMAHLSGLAEEVVLWTSPQFGFAELPDSIATGSSIMPQKRNPDVAELVRGKAGTAAGALVSLLTTLKGLPLSYNRDLQEDKAAVFAALEAAKESLEVVALLVDSLAFRPAAMRAALDRGYLNATDAADYLAARGVPFREAHRIAGLAVARAASKGVALEALTPAEWKRLSPAFGKDISAFLAPEACIARRRTYGGTAPEAVRVQMREARAALLAVRRRSLVAKRLEERVERTLLGDADPA